MGTKFLTLRMSEQEKRAVRMLAAESDSDMSEYMMKLLRQQPRFLELATSDPIMGQNNPILGQFSNDSNLPDPTTEPAKHND